MSHLYSQIHKYDGPPQFDRKVSGASGASGGESTVSDVTLEHALKPPPDAELLPPPPDVESLDEVLQEDLLKPDPDEVLKDDPDITVSEEGSAAIAIVEDGATEYDVSIAGKSGEVQPLDKLESIQYSEQASLPEDRAVYQLDELEIDEPGKGPIGGGTSDSAGRRRWHLIGGAVALLIVAAIVATVVVLTSKRNGNNEPSSGNKDDSPTVPPQKTPSPVETIPASPKPSPITQVPVTPIPVQAPVAAPSDTPNISPTQIPLMPPSNVTTSPTNASTTPQSTLAPAINPTDINTTILLTQRISGLLLSEAFDGGEALQTPGTPQNEAYQWLLNNTLLGQYMDYNILQRYSAVTLYSATNGSSWTESEFWLSDLPLCQWNSTVDYDLRCVQDEILAALALTGNRLSGTLPLEIAHMYALVAIILHGNGLFGPIPSEIFSELQSLAFVDFWLNDLSGTLHTEIGLCKELTFFDVDTNFLSGTLPTELGELSSIQTLWLNNNDFTGEIPTELGRLMTLEELYLTDNSFTGVVPREVCALPSLTSLEVDCDVGCSCCTNQCNETRPDVPAPTAAPTLTNSPTSVSLAGIGNLIASLVFDGGASMQVPGSTQNRALQWLIRTLGTADLPVQRLLQRYVLATLYYSMGGEGWIIQGSWLSEINECLWFESDNGAPICADGEIIEIALDSNNLIGTIPEEIALLTKLTSVALYNNKLSGSIPSSIGYLTNLVTTLDFDSNSLTGSIPESLGNLVNLQVLWLKTNDLSGSIPTALGRMSGLVEMYLQENSRLTGTMPQEICAINVSVLQVDCENILCTCCRPVC